MTPRTPPNTRVCPHCGTTLARNAHECWFCRLAGAEGELEPLLSDTSQPKRWQFSLRALLTVMTALGIYFGASAAVPLLWLGIPLLVATVLPLVVLRRKVVRGQYVPAQFGFNCQRGFDVLLAILLAVPAGCAALFSTCSISAVIMLRRPGTDPWHAYGGGVSVGLPVATAVVLGLGVYLVSAQPSRRNS